MVKNIYKTCQYHSKHTDLDISRLSLTTTVTTGELSITKQIMKECKEIEGLFHDRFEWTFFTLDEEEDMDEDLVGDVGFGIRGERHRELFPFGGEDIAETEDVMVEKISELFEDMDEEDRPVIVRQEKMEE